MKHLLQQFGRALVVYAGAAYVGDRLVRPHWSLRQARKAAKKHDKPLLVIGHGLRRPLGDTSFDVAVDELPLPADDGSIGCVLILHALEYAENPLAIAAEAERVLAEGGEVMITSSHPAMLHSWLGRRWVLFDLEDGRKHARPVWGARRAPPLEGPQEAQEASEGAETRPDPSQDV